MKVCLVCSPGGHLVEMLQLLDAFQDYSVVLITHEEKFISGLENSYPLKIYRIRYHQIRPLWLSHIDYMIRAGFISLKVLRKERPEVFISNGAEIAIPVCYLAKLFGKKIIYIESICRVRKLSVTGQAVSRIADLFLVQWESLLQKYKNAKYLGRLV